MRHRALLAALVLATVPFAASAQSSEDLKNDEKTPGDILVYGMGYSAHRYSPLSSINTQNARRMVPAWSYSMGDNRGVEAQPLVKDGVIYVTDHEKTVAVDALTGKQIWKAMIEYEPETTRVVCCGIVNRGGAIYDGKFFRTTLDANVIALDLKTGKEVWRTKSADPKDGYSMTVAPLVVDDVVIAGVSGAEYGVRGYLEGFDAKTGKSLWRTYTVPAPGEPGSNTWPQGSAVRGGSTWVTGTYDPALDLVYWGVGNPAPWNPGNRAGDNLYTNSVLALRPRTGKVEWYYQMSPNDPFDYDGVNEWIVADLNVGGTPRRTIIQANRNGFMYVLDRTNGTLIAASKFVKVNWAEKIDMATGRPVWTEATKAVIERGEKQRIYPAVSGGKNWAPMAFNPTTGLVYINTLDWGMDYEPLPKETLLNLKPGQPHYGVKFPPVFEPDMRGHLKAIDPLTGSVKWEVPFASPNISGTLVTAGGLVFAGQLTGEFMAFDASNGKLLWSFQTSSGISGQPVTWEYKGRQYVSVTSGIGGVYALKIGDPRLASVPPGGSLWTFKLFED